MDHVAQLVLLRHPAKTVIHSLACPPAQQPVTEGPERSLAMADPERSAFPCPVVAGSCGYGFLRCSVLDVGA